GGQHIRPAPGNHAEPIGNGQRGSGREHMPTLARNRSGGWLD
ncbi:MAG: hypothetical protein QOE24_465, partial [Frankiales bacterium]|nr:hypothetical protein [Frankiales bacterium]